MKKPPLPFSSAARSIVIGGIYEHYKKKRYKILAIARHSETLEELVVYQPLYAEGDIWVRPVAMFVESISVDGPRIRNRCCRRPRQLSHQMRSYEDK